MNGVRTEKPTLVRPPRQLAPPAVRWALSRLGTVAPETAARFAQRLFFTPARAALREPQRRILEDGAREEITARGERVAYWSWGEGPAVLLVHGWGGCAGQMTEFVRPLVRAGFRALAADFPGHGASSGSRSSLVHFAETIEALAGRIGAVDRVVAHSLGAASAIVAATRGVEIRRAAFLAPWSSFQGVWGRFRQGAGLSFPVWERMVRRSEEWLGVRFDDVDPMRLAPRLRFPLLILHDPVDREVPFSEGAALAKLWPGSELRSVDAGGHMRMLRDAACVDHAVAFVSSEFPGRAEVDPAGGRGEELRIEA